MAEEKSDFKVVDRRGVQGEASKADGEGFVMKDKPVESPTTAADIDFSTLVLSVATGALIQLGAAPDPITKKTTKNLDLAKQNIEILAMLEKKTKGNLTTEEVQLMENLLAEVRMRFVEASRKA